jgi:hypothetical protein
MALIDLALVLLVSLAGAPEPSPAAAVAAAPAPMHVTACRLAVENHGPRGSVEQVVIVSFANDRDAAADEARFTVSSAGGVAKAFTAHGSFTKGVLIADRIIPASGLSSQRGSGERTSTCVLTYAHFIDGTSWTAMP